jgi:hypothetical protein
MDRPPVKCPRCGQLNAAENTAGDIGPALFDFMILNWFLRNPDYFNR